MSRWLTEARAAMAANRPPTSRAPNIGDFGDIGNAAEKTERPRHYRAGDAEERAAIVAESEGVYGPPDPPERHAAIVAGLLAASGRRHPPSWSDHAQRPQRGAVCACCGSRRWWGNETGWRCATCYPPITGTTPDTMET